MPATMPAKSLAFLAARLDEDEAEARRGAGPPSLRRRQLREAEAKRQILTWAESQSGYDLPDGVHDGRDPDERESDQQLSDMLSDIMRVLAAVYSDHPDYREVMR